MVMLLDALERAGIVARRPSQQDRRRNVVELTGTGAKLFEETEQASLAVEREFTRALGADGASALVADLRSLLAAATD
jgi:DNA-binding MarR family transcriptional regulator